MQWGGLPSQALREASANDSTRRSSVSSVRVCAALGIGDGRPRAEQAVDLVDYMERKQGRGIDPSEVIRLYGISRLSYDRARRQKHPAG